MSCMLLDIQKKKNSSEDQIKFGAMDRTSTGIQLKDQLLIALRELTSMIKSGKPQVPSVADFSAAIRPPIMRSAHLSPTARFTSMFNLSIRYWDKNLPKLALSEVRHISCTGNHS